MRTGTMPFSRITRHSRIIVALHCARVSSPASMSFSGSCHQVP